MQRKVGFLLLLLAVINTASSVRQGRYFSRSSPYQQQYPKRKSAQLRKNLINVYEARNLEFGFPSEDERQTALKYGYYDPDTPLPIDVDVYCPPNSGKPKVFITIPRFGTGVPYSLAYLTDVQRPNGTEIQPYPSYDWHKSHGADCNGLTSVYRIQIDNCGKMWILDSGEIEFVQYCAPSLVVIDLKTDKITHRYYLPEDDFKKNISRFITPLVDIVDPAPEGRCEKAFVYMADPTGLGFVVYDVEHGTSWRIENKYTYPDPDFSTHTIAGESFELLDGVFTFAVTPRNLGLERMLYFHSLSNDAEVAIPLDIVNDPSYWGDGITSSLDKFKLLGKRGVQCAASAMTPNGFLLCGFLEPIGIFGWNIRTPYTFSNRILLAENADTLQFISGIKVIEPTPGRHELWVMSNRLQKAFTGTMDFREINYRIQRCGINELLSGKPCQP